MSEIEKPHLQLPRHDRQGRLRWFAAEFLVVVSGILVALAVDAWWSDRTERVQERELLEGLRAEFVANRVLFERTMDLHEETIEQARQLLDLTGPDPNDIDPTKVDELLFPLLSEMPSFHPAMGEVEAMLGSGQLGLIRNDRLRTVVAAWPGTLALLRETEDEMREDVIRGFYPYVLERVPLVQPLVSGTLNSFITPGNDDISLRRVDDVKKLLTLLRRDTMFCEHFFKYSNHAVPFRLCNV